MSEIAISINLWLDLCLHSQLGLIDRCPGSNSSRNTVQKQLCGYNGWCQPDPVFQNVCSLKWFSKIRIESGLKKIIIILECFRDDALYLIRENVSTQVGAFAPSVPDVLSAVLLEWWSFGCSWEAELGKNQKQNRFWHGTKHHEGSGKWGFGMTAITAQTRTNRNYFILFPLVQFAQVM